ncbi:hypothetical protein QR98_0102590 [Sarcoptes scabiei]|uniref:Rap-GAP domain-containing protein n=1 Tax=Sarcoptes scabiei TaxID=52283 RepID=A0A132AL36_SARSC|nr:hypothetical protein QR98_0102590 [Sarcoptes scabiei]
MDYSCATLISYYPRLILNLILGLHNETDHNNIQMILNALLFVVEDCCNQSDTIVFQQSPTNHESSFPFNLYDFFNKEDFDFDEVHRDRMLDINLFLLINSIVADILCKSSLRNSNYNISLTALEILSALAQIRKFDSDGKKNYLCNQKCSLFIRKICEFIENQCYKPSMFHSKDMHSTIVAAYQCLCVWIHEHLHLIKDLDCITILFELIELGISGTKSKKGEEFKSDKILKPASLRVREAAELLLNTMMSRMEFSSGLRNRDDIIIDCDLNELKINEIFTKLKMKSASLLNNFRHFVVDNSILISIFDGEIDNEETVCFVRSAYGKYCFALKNRFVSKRKNERNSSVDRSNLSEKHFDNYDSIPSQNFIYFPEFYDQIATTKHDSSILKLQKFVNENENLREDFETMQNFLEKVEQNLSFEKAKLSIGTSNITELVEPAPTDSFEAFRLVMSQFEIFNFDLKNISPMKNSSLTLLQDGNGDFINHLSRLDLVSGKMNDFIMIFYVPKDFICEDEILFASSYQYLHNSTFRSFLNMLGKRISCNTKLASNLFYWNDVLHETIFISPHKPENILDKFSLDIFIKESNESIRQKFFQKSSSNGVDGDDAQQSNLVREFFYHNLGCDVKIFVFWIEKIEDFDRLPFNSKFFRCLFFAKKLSIIFKTDIDVKEESDYQHHSNPSSDSQRKQFSIIINPLKNGLFRVFNYSTGINRSAFTIDRMILSKQLLATYVRFFALNSFRRRRMNIESFQLPHVKRRLKIQEIANKFKSNHDPLKSIGDIFKPKVF